MTITIDGLSKNYGHFAALKNLSLEIPSAAVFGLLGPNGAGKTTTFKCMLGLARPTLGTVLFDGSPLRPEHFERIAYVPEKPVLYRWMTLCDHLELQRRSYKRFDEARARELVDLFGLDMRKRIGKMSKGQQTAAAVTLAFAIVPDLLVLDEPTSGLDPVNQRAVLKLIVDAAARGATVVLSSHQIGQVERAAEHIAVLNGGELALRGEVDALKVEQKIVEAIFPSDQIATDGLTTDSRVSRVERTGRILRVTVRSDGHAIAQQLQNDGALNVRVLDLNLEDIFLNAVGSSGDTGAVGAA